jgi:hypothetical protein
MKRRFALAIAVATCSVLAIAAGATAGSPIHFTDSVSYAWDDPGGAATPCGSFDDRYMGHFDISGITQLDKNGTPVQDVYHVSGWETNWRSDDPSVSYTIRRQFTVQYDYATNTEKDTGIIYTVSAPGAGLLFHDVGNIGEDDTTFQFLYIHGPHDVATNGDQTFCDALLAVS